MNLSNKQQKLNERFTRIMENLCDMIEVLNERINIHQEEIKKLKEKYEKQN